MEPTRNSSQPELDRGSDGRTVTGGLLSFAAENVRSIRDQVELSLLSLSMAEPGVPRVVELGPQKRTTRVSPVAGIFGANASGKSNVLKAMSDMRVLVLGSFRWSSPGAPLPYRPFRLDADSAQSPSAYAIDLVYNRRRYQYGFEIDQTRVVSEYAMHYPNGRQALLFERDDDGIRWGQPMKAEGRRLELLIPDNALVLSTAGATRSSALNELFAWFGANLRLAESDTRGLRSARTAQLAQDESTRSRVLALLQAADLGIAGVSSRELDSDTQERLLRAVRILNGLEGEPEDDDEFVIGNYVQLTHCVGEVCVEFDSEEESVGTRVWLGAIGPVLDTLDGGWVLLADELDASLHPHLVHRLIALFQDPVTNPLGAQLVFNSHDTSVMSAMGGANLGRDQIWFTERGENGATSLFPLSDFGPRKDDSIERRYLSGRYGGVPVMSPTELHPALETV